MHPVESRRIDGDGKGFRIPERNRTEGNEMGRILEKFRKGESGIRWISLLKWPA